MHETPGFHDENRPPGQQMTVSQGMHPVSPWKLCRSCFFYSTGLAKVGTMFLLRVSVIATIPSIRWSVTYIHHYGLKTALKYPSCFSPTGTILILVNCVCLRMDKVTENTWCVYIVRFRWRSGFAINDPARPAVNIPALQAIAAIPDPTVSFPSIASMANSIRSDPSISTNVSSLKSVLHRFHWMSWSMPRTGVWPGLKNWVPSFTTCIACLTICTEAALSGKSGSTPITALGLMLSSPMRLELKPAHVTISPLSRMVFLLRMRSHAWAIQA